jgi:ABC-2 type transport system ATP-binding protein
VSSPAVRIEEVSKRFRIYHERNQTLKSAVMRRRRSVHEDFWALRDVSMTIPQGAAFAIVGNNGSGKSTLLKCVAKILYPNSGSITTRGRVAALLEVGSGFHPELSGRDNVYLNASILGMTRPEIRRKFDEIVDFSGVGEFIDQPVKNYSSGMYVRLGFSVAINVDPEVLLADEVLAVGDAAFQEKCVEKFAQFRREGRTVVLVSHSMPQLRSMCDQAAWLQHGCLMDVGSAKTVLERYHDSTRSHLEVSEEGQVSWGSGEISVDSIEVLDTHRRPWGGFVPTGAPVVLRLRYTANEPLTDPVFGITIESTNGTLVWNDNNRDAGVPANPVHGPGVVELTIPEFRLMSGEFLVHGTIADSSLQHIYHHVREVTRVSVGRSVRSEAGGLVSLGGTWGVPVGRATGTDNEEQS